VLCGLRASDRRPEAAATILVGKVDEPILGVYFARRACGGGCAAGASAASSRKA